ncbi:MULTISPECIES: cell division protein FtsB [unclassified Undibacterium]|uniref:cell division protein FtsB n=1 Tax=unclassified Undibacterium TaxID=2630295 RepID=UPI002AC98E0F|nr:MULTISPECIES: cell division protein FtsB [unclassified Undibacterium]MEB0140691.1 cell division protein FtsB [Undibacterium sp. CCC2.1]MEB0173693.1 cell division protein FtsB [Undibacterium sp. CCC1.1]MEB0177675.1 cell division protein FtsB [Undibacterium sp. CCC3.4]MEB0216860.1 cell division protein FtsB [Undibacterium sp. 5I2]WPX43359.1 cell division protein FtsB [Undibacterium sp. CCC3.4]
MRLIAVCFLLLLAMIQYPLWLGKGGWLRVWEFERQVALAQNNNDKLKQRNATLESEVVDLKDGTDSVEERARFELGMIKKDEIFVQILDANAVMMAPAPAAVTEALRR